MRIIEGRNNISQEISDNNEAVPLKNFGDTFRGEAR